MSRSDKQLRFAALIRVSTEKQEKKGESLRTQTTHVKESVKEIRGKLVGWYGGQEHATPGYEKKEVDRLISDAQKGKFDAIIISYLDRWSRDNEKSAQGLNVFQKHKIQFYVGSMEYKLSDTQQRMVIEQAAVLGQFFAANQNKKSIENRIHRGRRGIPTSGKMPVGRSYVKETDEWVIDKEKQAMLKDAAERYLAGEPLKHIAADYGVNHANLHKTLTQRCGPSWTMNFKSDRFEIGDEITLTVPELLPKATIEAIHKRVAANKTYSRGNLKYKYLLNRMVFCEHCGYAMSGQSNAQGVLYYRHPGKDRERKCIGRKWLRADLLEENVLRQLFIVLGNPKATERAIDRAVPNRAKIAELRRRRTDVEATIVKVEAGIKRVTKAIFDGTLDDDDVKRQMDEWKQQESRQREALATIDAELSNVPSPEAVRQAANEISAKLGQRHRISAREFAARQVWNNHYDRMSWDDKRALAEIVFAGMTPDGKRMGIFVKWDDDVRDAKWRYSIRGRVNVENLPVQQGNGLAKNDGEVNLKNLKPRRGAGLDAILDRSYHLRVTHSALY